MEDENLWIGTFSGGLDILDLKSNRFRNYRHNPNDTTSIANDCIFSIYKDNRNDIYLGTMGGLCRYNRLKNNFVPVRQVPVFVYDIKEDVYGYLWIASYSNGVFRYEYKTNEWKHYLHNLHNPKSLAYNKLTSIYADGKNRLWFATEGGGICKYNYDTDDFTTINERNGIPNNVIYSILDDKYGNLWLSSNRGISCLNPETMQIKTYTRTDGLQGNQFNYRSGYKSTDGLFYFGGINGFNVFDPNKLIENTHILPVVITSVEILDEHIVKQKAVQKLQLKYNQASFRINFVSLSFLVPEKNEYAYMLEGMDEQWTHLGTQRMVSFSNLPPGKYVFRVKASNNNGVWNHKGVWMDIVVLPPFWKSAWAYLLYGLLGIGLAFLIYNYLKQIGLHRMEKIHQQKEKEMYLNKINFFTNIAHEIRTPISLIKAPLEAIILSKEGTPNTKNNLSIIERNTDRLLNLITQLLDFRKIENNNYNTQSEYLIINDLLNEIGFRFRPTIDQYQIDLEMNIPAEPLRTYTDREMLTKIIENLLTNALKYAHLRISVDLKEINDGAGDYFEISVSDDGSGIPNEMKERIFEPFFQIGSESAHGQHGSGIGLALTKQLVEQMNGEIRIIDNPQNGVTFAVKMALRKESDKDEPARMESKKQSQKTVNILIVEDNSEVRNFLSENLNPEYTIYGAANGKLALQLLEKQWIHLIVSDILMPEMDGLALLQAVKQNEQLSHIPIILLSAKTDLHTKIEGLEYGADSYIEKPFSIVYLKAQIHSLLEKQKKLAYKFSKSPLIPPDMIAQNKQDELFLKKINDYIIEHIADEKFSINDMAFSCAMSRSKMQRKLKDISGFAPNDYIHIIKLKSAAQLLLSNQIPIKEVYEAVGFGDASYFSKSFMKYFGVLPKDFVKQNS
ncbi:hypothetical protein FACS189413_04560 [Bacteroidia bacterium]|nr:hypothetical protein FACS189413_04560 [Bacteroidia bacterium]